MKEIAEQQPSDSFVVESLRIVVGFREVVDDLLNILLLGRRLDVSNNLLDLVLLSLFVTTEGGNDYNENKENRHNTSHINSLSLANFVGCVVGLPPRYPLKSKWYHGISFLLRWAVCLIIISAA